MEKNTDFRISRDEVLNKVLQLGLKISVTTLNRYVRAKLITPPKRGSRGRGLGTFAFYHDGAHIELATVYCLLQRIVPPIGVLSEIRVDDDQSNSICSLPKIQLLDIRRAREGFVQKYIGESFKGIIKDILKKYCEEMTLFDDLPVSIDKVDNTDSGAWWLNEYHFIGEHTNYELAKIMQDDLFSSISEPSDPSEAIRKMYGGLFKRFAVWDSIINSNNTK